MTALNKKYRQFEYFVIARIDDRASLTIQPSIDHIFYECMDVTALIFRYLVRNLKIIENTWRISSKSFVTMSYMYIKENGDL